jgi:carbonic anhydrase
MISINIDDLLLVRNDDDARENQRHPRRIRAQSDSAVVVCCSDSKTPPEKLLRSGMTTVFVRTAGCALGDIGLESVLYTLDHVGAKLVIILGHDGCGAVSSACSCIQSSKLPTCKYPLVMDNIMSSFSHMVRQKIIKHPKGKSIVQYAIKKHLHRVKSDIVSRVAKDITVIACIHGFDGHIRILQDKTHNKK